MKRTIQLFVLFITIFLTNISLASDIIADIPKAPTQALILIHGWGQEGKDMMSLGKIFQKDFPDMAIYYPTAPDKREFGGYEWFVIPSLGETMNTQDIYTQMMSSALNNVNVLHELISQIHNTQHIDYKNIHLSGFSQGGFMAILTALTSSKQLGKVISFSGVPLMFTQDFSKKELDFLPSILIIQGNNDKIIPNNSYELTKNTLKSLNISPTIRIINQMPHTINFQAIQYAKEFLQN